MNKTCMEKLKRKLFCKKLAKIIEIYNKNNEHKNLLTKYSDIFCNGRIF